MAAEQRGRAAGLCGSVAVLAAALGWAEPAAGFCRTTTCDANVEDCSPDPGQGCTTKGLPLYWPVLCTSYNLRADSTPGITYDEFAAVAYAAFNAWVEVDCGGQGPSIQVHDLGPVAEASACYNQNAGNSNAVFFHSKKWPYADPGNTLALTTVTFNTETGEIYDVDMEINSARNHITAGDGSVDYDLQSILTHEAGHFYGLGHTGLSSATMYQTYAAGTTGLRYLGDDDVQGMCAIYPPGRETSGVCDPTPRHGFGEKCDDAVPPEGSGCCSSAVAPARSSGQGAGAVLLALAGLALWRTRRRPG